MGLLGFQVAGARAAVVKFDVGEASVARDLVNERGRSEPCY
jgi:hypothetical protein